MMLVSFTAQHFAGLRSLIRTSSSSPLVIVSVINIQLQLMNFIMKTLCPSENITYPKDLLFFSPLYLFCFPA